MGMGPLRRSGGGLYQPLADINVTPLVDVMLVLLIVFMITAPMLAAGVKINLPQAKKSAQPMKAKDPVTITVSKDGHVFVNADETAKEVLIETVKAKLVGAEDTPIRLRGDKDSSYGDVLVVLDLLSSNGLTKIALMSNTRPTPESSSAGARVPAAPATASPAPAAASPAPAATSP